MFIKDFLFKEETKPKTNKAPRRLHLKTKELDFTKYNSKKTQMG